MKKEQNLATKIIIYIKHQIFLVNINATAGDKYEN